MAPNAVLRKAILFCFFFATVSADVRTYDFTVGWVNRNPDGQHERRVMGINGQWPIPTIHATVGDQVIVNLHNNLGDRPCSLHFHGLYMNGTNHMDGVAQTNQCPIPSGSNFTYAFNVTQPGTYWYHSHVDGQYPDGLRGPLIVHDPKHPYADLFDEELVVTLSDWYHDEMPGLISSFLSVGNPTGAEPVPDSALQNDTQNLQIPVQPGKTYFIRIINMAAFAAQYFWIEGHNFRIIEVDGIYHEPAEADMIYITAAQRYGILLTTKNSTDANFPIVGAMDQDLFDKVPDGLNPNVTSFLVYNSEAPMPKAADVDDYDAVFDDVKLVPTDHEPLFTDPVQSYTIEVKMDNLGDGANYAFFNDITFVRPKVPTLYTVLTSGNQSTDATIYGVNTHPIILEHNQVFEVVLNNHDPGKHPFHLHGHAFQVLARGEDESGDWDPEALRNGSVTFPRYPMRRDTLLVRPDGHFVIRFRSDNPGVWLFHCHIEWHVDSGLILSFIEAPLALQKQLAGNIPDDHFKACAAANPPMPTEGNAAGNTVNLLDLSGANVSPAPLPDGFTPRGIVALTFSIVAGLLGIAVVAWYGLGEMGAIEQEREQRKIEQQAQDAGITPVMSSAGAGNLTGASGADGNGDVIQHATAATNTATVTKG